MDAPKTSSARSADLRWVGAPVEGGYTPEQAKAFHELKGSRWLRARPVGRQNAQEFVPDSFPGQRGGGLCVPPQRVVRGGIKLKAKARRESHCAQEPQRILREALPGIADRPKHPISQVRRAAILVDQNSMPPSRA